MAGVQYTVQVLYLAPFSFRISQYRNFLHALIFPTVLPGARPSYKPSKFFFWRWFSWIFCAVFTCTLRLLHGIGRLTPSDHMSRVLTSFIFSCSFLARAFAEQITFSISVCCGFSRISAEPIYHSVVLEFYAGLVLH